MNYSKHLARAQEGDVIKILGFSGTMYESERKLIGKTGTVTRVNDDGSLSGTWGGLSILPEDNYEVIGHC